MRRMLTPETLWYFRRASEAHKVRVTLYTDNQPSCSR